MIIVENNRKLGKGLEALLGTDVNDFIDELEHNYDKNAVMEISLNEISSNPYQPRTVFDEEKIAELAQSIATHGVFQPIIVKKSSKGYNIVAGERRYRASLSANLASIPAVVVDLNDQQMMEIALIENIQREDLNPIEEANALKTIMEKYQYTQEELGKSLGKSRSHIANMLRLLSLNGKVKEMILTGKLSMGHAKVLIGLEDEVVDVVVNEVISKKLNVRDTEKLVNDLKNNVKPTSRIVKEVSEDVLEVENLLREKFNTRIKISPSSISFNYSDDDDLIRIVDIMGIKVN